jgi:hypothetical protein
MSAMIQMSVPFETMYAEYGITAAEWSQISTAWVDALTKGSRSRHEVRGRSGGGAREAASLSG